ncbi:NnrS family protein [Hoeflea sp.]|uniref:NnrS family protein n=1 Tax=Hoeflea sp. TaxID=1940281 RepID=UPI0025C2BE77|nr:NnrS family protein [Hoeflea sp.]MBU4529464.1 NnrS family protein [Alphaproteobacteria bacterium]MBU4546583.1 NnrS family protein [Alphaproteobacteria bacterium]MBU4550851.1 NnrS family protein [Alphaproteobacteria bacterium]
MATTAEQMRAWQGPAILSFGFRPFFLLGAAWAAIAMVVWVMMLSGNSPLLTAFDPVAWHAHELLFGYLGAVLAGFLLTAVPNWTGGLPVTGWPLAGLVALWLIGRIAVAVSAALPPYAAMALDLALPVALAGVLLREIIVGRNWRNLPVLSLLAIWMLANAGFHIQALGDGLPAYGAELRLGLLAAIMLISLIGGRIVPSFTRNWLVQQKATRFPAIAGRTDKIILLATAIALAAWVAAPEHAATAALCGLAGLGQTYRLFGWQGRQTSAEPLVWVLHVAYAFVPLGFFAIAGAALLDYPTAAAQHVWMAGGIGLMTLAVMSRASLGHAGRPLKATPAITALYVALIVSVAARFMAGLAPGEDWPLHLAAGAWILAFGGFAVIYFPILARPKLARKAPSGGKVAAR